MGSGGTKHMDVTVDNGGVWLSVIFTAEVVNGTREVFSFPLTLHRDRNKQKYSAE